MPKPKRVTIVGSGNWGSAIAKIIGNNALEHRDTFEQTVRMYVYEEIVNGRKLSEIINNDHENIKYLPGIRLPDNIVAVTDIKDATKGADILVFVLPHQFIRPLCVTMREHKTLSPEAVGVTLIKGLDMKDGYLRLISEVITEFLEIPCSVLMGANLADEVCREFFCEATLGATDPVAGRILHKLFQTSYFRIIVCDDVCTTEVCGALKNVVATAGGFVDGLGHGNNTKAAVIRLGLLEMIKFTKQFFAGTKLSTFFESCGIADLVTTSYAGRNKRVAMEFAKRNGKSTMFEIEKELLNGQRIQGVPTAAEVNQMLKMKGAEKQYPLFTATHMICTGQMPVAHFIDFLSARTSSLESVESLFDESHNKRFSTYNF